MPAHRALAAAHCQELRVELLAQKRRRHELACAVFAALTALVEFERRNGLEPVALSERIEQHLAAGT